MRIAKLHWAFPPIIGGVETHLTILGPELIKEGCEIHLLTNSLSGEREERTYDNMQITGTPLMDLNSLTPERIQRLAGEIEDELTVFLEKSRPDILHAHNMHYFSPVHARVLAKLKKKLDIPLVLTAHNVWDDDLWETMNLRAGEWDEVIAVSHYIKTELIAVGYPEDRITAVHHGIDVNHYLPPTEEDVEEAYRRYPNFAGRRVIFHPARMSLDKGCHVSVKALSRIVEEFPDVLLVMAGTEKTVDWGNHQQKHVNKISQMVEELGLQDHVFARFFPFEDMPYVYQAAEICVYPSCFEEPFGLVMLEAQATAKPIVVSRAGGMPEVIKNGENGYIVEMENHEALANRCAYLLCNPQLARTMGQTGRRYVEEGFTKEIMTAHTLEVYRRARHRLGR
ncbi:MAG: glycosyltransferase family 4 protein [Thermincolia bacterium]